MRSIKEIFVIGHGPSSSHTMAPAKACDYVLSNYKDISRIEVTLYGSLASTSKGHLTDYIINLKLKDIPHKIILDFDTKTKHPNTMLFNVIDSHGNSHIEKILSIGGGTIVTRDNYNDVGKEIYPHKSFKEILDYCAEKNMSLKDYVLSYEDDDIRAYISNCIDAINKSIENGRNKDGLLPGNLNVHRKAKSMFKNVKNNDQDQLMMASAFAVAEENASGSEIVISPTCGSAGVFGGIIGYFNSLNLDKESIIDALLVSGLLGIICKTNATVSGAEAGCQAEIGVACSMGAGAIAFSKGYTNEKIAQAAEIALEHSLGLTCDPVQGYVQIPCIERCAIYSLKAKNAVELAGLISCNESKISFDDSLRTMYTTGKDLSSGYRETGEKGLSEIYKK